MLWHTGCQHPDSGTLHVYADRRVCLKGVGGTSRAPWRSVDESAVNLGHRGPRPPTCQMFSKWVVVHFESRFFGAILIANSRTGSPGPIVRTWVRVTPEKKGVTELWELRPDGAFAYRRIADSTGRSENKFFGRWHVEDSVLAVWRDDEPWSVRRPLGGTSDKTPIFLISSDEFGLGGKGPRNTCRRSKNR